MERAIEIFVFIVFAVIGLSHLFRPLAWTEFFAIIKSKGSAGVLMIGLLSLPVGAIVVSFHNVWSGLPIVVTLLGWGQLVKATMYLCIPGVGERGLSMIDQRPKEKFMAAGLMMLLIIAPIGVHLFR